MRMQHVILCGLLALVPSGCHWGAKETPGYQTVATDLHRNTELARQHNAQAVELIKAGEFDQAEKALKAAIEADLFFGPAHNNLGNVYYRQKKYYLAAWEFQYAIKLMPKKAQPRNNLGMVFEAVGQLQDASKWYETALELEPDDVEIVGNLARVYVRENRKDQRTRQLLEEIVFKDQRPEWVTWARERLVTMPKPQPSPTQPPTEP